MSPVSRGRKKKKQQQRRRPPRQSSGAPRGAAADPIDILHGEMLDAFRPLATSADPLEAELCASDLLGTWWKQLPPGTDPDRMIGLSMVDHAARDGSPAALALLRAVEVVGVTEEQREAAAAAAAQLADAGVAAPPWAGKIGRVSVRECWQWGGEFQASLLLVFSYGSRRHGLVVLLDRVDDRGGWVKDLFITLKTGEMLRELRRSERSNPFTVLERIEPAEARRQLERGLAATDVTQMRWVSDELRQCRALALARCRAMPEPEPAGEPEPETGQEILTDPGVQPYVRDLDTSGGLDSVREAIDRRRFAMPFSSTRIGDEDFPFMDPGDPDDRIMLIEGEHPEYHDLLSDPTFEGEIDGVSPRAHLAIHEVVVNQLWDDNPPGAWRAAKRLRDAGVDRHDILHQLGEVVMIQIHGVLTARGRGAPTPDWSGFDALRPPRSRRQAEREAGRKKAR
jgi:hypothetical protein